MLKKTIALLSNQKGSIGAIFITATLLSFFFSFVVLPGIDKEGKRFIDPDQYGALGKSLVVNHSLAYYPDTEPTVQRGPVYPVFIALMIMIADDSYFYAVQGVQGLMFGLICVLTFVIGTRLFNRETGFVSAVCASFCPLLIMYASRLFMETTITLLLLLIVWLYIVLWQNGSLTTAIFLGIALAIGSLTKSIILPFIFLLPLFVLFGSEKKIGLRNTATIMSVALVLMSSWALRNYNLTQRFIPVHTTLGFNMIMGNEFAKNWEIAPLSYNSLWQIGHTRILEIAKIPDTGEIVRWENFNDPQLDSTFTKASFEDFLNDPMFLLQKIGLNSIWFWCLGGSPLSTIVNCAIKIPILLLFVISGVRFLFNTNNSTLHLSLVLFVFIYCCIHLPIFAFGRLSTVLLPIMLTLGIGNFSGWLSSKKSLNP